MNCRQAEDLFGDYFDDRLAIPLRTDLDDHLANCASCRELKEDYGRIVESLTALEAPSPATKLEEQILAKLLPHVRTDQFHERALAMPSWRNIAVWAAAAVLTMAFIGPRFGVGARFGRELSQSSHRLYSFGAKAYRESERIIDELNVLRMAVGVAFEDRLDILNEKLRDLEQAQQPSDDPSEQSRRTGPSAIVSGPKPIRSTL